MVRILPFLLPPATSPAARQDNTLTEAVASWHTGPEMQVLVDAAYPGEKKP